VRNNGILCACTTPRTRMCVWGTADQHLVYKMYRYILKPVWTYCCGVPQPNQTWIHSTLSVQGSSNRVLVRDKWILT